MIYLNKDEENIFVLTLSESSQIENPVWLFKFTWETDLDPTPVYWIGTDSSSYTYRYNKFELEEGVDLTLNIGQHSYKVFEAPEGSTPVDETGLTLIEEGRLLVSGVANSIYD